LHLRPPTSPIRRSNNSVSVEAKATVGGALGAVRFIIVNQNTRQLRTQKTVIRLDSRSAVRSLESSPRHPDFRILWKTSIFQLMPYQMIFSTISERVRAGRSVSSFQSVGLRPFGAPRSVEWITVRSNAG